MYVELKNINKTYGDYKASDNVSFGIEKGKLIGLLGPSGSGKTTILRMIAGLEQPDSGEIIIDGRVVNDVPASERGIGFVFQNYALFRYMTVYDNIAFGPRTHGIHAKTELDEIVERSLKQAAIWDEVKDRLGKSAMGLSGGQQQRLCIARALAIEPDVLLMDESTSALDPISTSKIEDLVIELKKKYSIVMVTHNMQQAVRISDKTAFFLMGEVVEFNKTSQLFSLPQDERTENYITGRFG